MNYPLTLVRFKSWLESKSVEEVVGIREKSHFCPIAKALKECVYSEEGNDVEVEFNYTSIDPEVDVICFRNPAWVTDFVERVDVLETSEVTAKDALQIVNNLYICTVCNQYNPEGTNCGKKDNCPW